MFRALTPIPESLYPEAPALKPTRPAGSGDLAQKLLRPHQLRNWFSRLLLICCICTAIVTATPLLAQSSEGEVTPTVQRLYAEAQTAEHSGDDATAIAKYRTIIRIAPRIAPAYNNLGMLYFNAQDYSDAVPVLEQGLRINPDMSTATALLALSYFELGDNEKAEPLLRRALKANPSDKHLQMSLIHVLLNLGKNQDAIQRLNVYLARNPKDQEAWYLLGETYLHLSESALAKVNQINPNSYVAHEVSGEIDESMRNYKVALQEFKQAVAQAPQQASTHFRLGNVYWVMGEWPLAEAQFQSGLALAPNDCMARWKLADSILQAGGSNTQALDNLNRSIARCPNLMQARVDRAHALIKLNRQKEALPDLLLAEKNSPDEPSIHFLLASVYRAMGRPSEARQQLEIYGNLLKQTNAAAAAAASQASAPQDTSH